MALIEKLTAIGDKIRERLGATALIPLSDMPDEIDEVHRQGEQSEYDRFWDSYQDYGKRTNYGGAFFGIGWNNETFKPKYDIVPSGSAINLFRQSNITGDLKKLLEDPGLVLDTSQTRSFEYSFFQNKFESLPLIDMSYDGKTSVTLSNVFAQSTNLKTLSIKVSEYTQFTNVFTGCTGLENLQITGTMGQNGFDVSTCTKLTHNSLMSIIGCLKDLSGTSTTKTCTLGATNLAKLTDEEKAIATQKGWTLA